MSVKQTRCPNCSTIYKVSVAQLTVAQGMVCCAKCSTNFNALSYIVKVENTSETDSSLNQTKSHDVLSFKKDLYDDNDIDAIFNQKIENSNIDLRTYLNNLNMLHHEPITAFPAMNLSAGQKDRPDHKKSHRKKTSYYIAWTIANIALIFIFIFQLLWFNPSLLAKSPILNSLFINTCAVFNCVTIDQRYKIMTIIQLKAVEMDHDVTEFSGVLINNYGKSLDLPLLKISLIEHGVVKASYIKQSSDYLVASLSGIERIPTKSPYKFKFTLNQPKNSFDSYKIEVIRP